jgi:(S)-ureidoglycine aminohydrolase
MKIISPFAFIAIATFSLPLQAQETPLKSGVYPIKTYKTTKAPFDNPLQILKGSTTMLADLDIALNGLKAGQKSAPQTYPDAEVMVIVTSGSRLRINAGNELKVVSEGGVALAAAGDKLILENLGNADVTYFLLKFTPKASPSTDRKQKSQGSFIIAWDATTFKPHDRGGRRDIFDRATNLFERFEMHVTTLNEGLASHDPHKHNAEEIILIKRGAAEMLIAGENMPMDTWDVAFLDSQVFHGITKGGKGEREYYAFQWEVTK